ncbi:MAG: hypothetical protein JST01_11725 [Cyanobacteria bacterium SZAS TMP-1]|nr:hypothetical protein [Cyanobacteria bacterium SZAS TMP-1]
MTITTQLPRPATTTMADDGLLTLLSVSESGGFVLSLPPSLQTYQPELEGLLGKVFSGRPTSAGNIALAKQMSINWCVSKCKQTGMSVDRCLEMIGYP